MDSLGLRGTQARWSRLRGLLPRSSVVTNSWILRRRLSASHECYGSSRIRAPLACPGWILEMRSLPEALVARRTAVSISPAYRYDELHPARVRIQDGDFAEADARSARWPATARATNRPTPCGS
jgi:hypothetical protein